ncbi:MAG: hypothetical protein ABIA37_00005, partial [Candidatus Woesearchaeota archaeon]
EYLNEELSYWTRSEEECLAETENIPNKKQYKTMMEKQLHILEYRLREIKERVPQAQKIVLSIDSDDLQYTVSAMVNEMLLRGQKEISESIKTLRTERQELKNTYKQAQKDFNPELPTRKRNALERRIKSHETKLTSLEDKIKDKEDEKKLYREKKVRPAHQYFTKRFLTKLYGKYKTLCSSLGIELITQPSQLNFDGLKIDYAHSRHRTWAVIKNREKSLLKSLHGSLDDYVKKGIDVLLESGHAGIGFKQIQKVKDCPAETNFKNQSSYSPEIGQDHLTIVLALPFEDQDRVSRFVRGGEPIRLSGGKPINTRKHAAVDRYQNGAVTGITILTKNEQGLIGTEWVQYHNFVNGSVLKQPNQYSFICASADEHIGSPEENILARDGWLALYKELLQGTSFRGKEAQAKGYINGGDAAEANSRRWDHRYHEKRDPQKLIRENLQLLSNFKPENIEQVLQLALKMTNDARGGSVESMRVILERVADYYESFLNETLKKSDLKCAHLVTTGNHADAILRDLGLRETDFFVQRLKARGICTYEVGQPDYYQNNLDARVFIGGYSNARILQVPDYGKDIQGKNLFGPINLVVQHDPKGHGGEGLIGAGKNVGADLSLAAHTHDSWLKVYKTRENQFSVAYKLATLQSVSPTEKYYASSLPRTQAAHCLIIPMAGDFSELALPASYLQKKGLEQLSQELKDPAEDPTHNHENPMQGDFRDAGDSSDLKRLRLSPSKQRDSQ